MSDGLELRMVEDGVDQGASEVFATRFFGDDYVADDGFVDTIGKHTRKS